MGARPLLVASAGRTRLCPTSPDNGEYVSALLSPPTSVCMLRSATRWAFAAFLSIGATQAQSPGQLDPSFSDDGKLTLVLDSTSPEGASDIVALEGGRTLVAGTTGGDAVLFVLTPEGELDASYGDEGLARIPVGADADAQGRAGRLISDGMGGAFVIVSRIEDGVVNKSYVARVSPGGELDTSYGVDGRATVGDAEEGGVFAALAPHPEGGVAVVGLRYTEEGPSLPIVGRFDAGGALDETFGGAGADAFIDAGSVPVVPQGLAFDQDGRAVVAGTFFDFEEADFEGFVLRLTPEGELDPTFANEGVLFPFSRPFVNGFSFLYDVAVSSSGAITAVGSDGARAVGIRLTAEGVIEEDFGQEGRILIPGDDSSSLVSVLLQSDGKLIAVGSENGQFDLFAARYTAGGDLDPSFGDGGVARTQFGPAIGVRGAALAATGEVMLAGSIEIQGLDDEAGFAFARLLNDGLPKTGNEAGPSAAEGLRLGAPFPNPTHGEVNMPFLSGSRDVGVDVFNVLGQRVAVAHGRPVATGFLQVDLALLPAGLYLLRVTDGASSVTRPIVKR